MSNYNTQLQSNNTDLQAVLQTLQTKAAGGGQATPVISVSSNGLITATAGTKASTHQLAFQPAKTITPGTASQVAVPSGYYTGGNVTVAGDANLVAGNIKSGVSIFGVAGTLQEGGGSGEAAEWSENEDVMITRTLSSYFNDRVTSIGQWAFAYAQNLKSVDFPNVKTISAYAFYSCKSLTTASFPACRIIGSNAFYSCKSLTTISFPACTTIGSNAFNVCSSLTTASFPACTSIGYYAFSGCESLTTASFPACTSIGYYAFSGCSSLTTISFPACTTIGSNAFHYCRKLTTVSFPACTTIGSSAFNGCMGLTTASFPACTSIGNYAFNGCSLTTISFPACTTIGSNAFNVCSSLTTASFPACTSIRNYAFSGCYRLQSFYLANSSVCKLSHSNAFSFTPYAGYSSYFSGTPYIYVPASLLTSYQTATNWTYFSSRFVGVDPDDPIEEELPE